MNLAASFQNVVNRQILTGNLINAQTLRKEKFPREFFSEVKTKTALDLIDDTLSSRLNGLEKVLLKHVGQSMACKCILYYCTSLLILFFR